jgi:transposase
MARFLLKDDQWKLIADIFPDPPTMGRPPRDPREIVDGILWILRTGSPWRDLPEEFGPWQTTWGTFNKWNDEGIVRQVLERLQAAFVDIGEIDHELWCVDGTTSRAHRCAAGGGKKGIQRNQLITH